MLLLRDGPDGLEVFMVLRHHEIDSFSGALVFPGGKVDPGDSQARAFCRDVDAVDDAALAFQIASIREAFEECGVLLARENGSESLLAADRLAPLEAAYRERLSRDEITIGDVCAEAGLELATDRLAHFAHWITPKMAPKLFDTHFYLAAAPDDQMALHDGQESTDSVWIRPADALAEAAHGRRTIVFPTQMNLRKLSRWKTTAEALAAAAAAKVVSVRPQVKPHPEGRTLTLPADADYDGQVFLARQKDELVVGIERLE